MKRAGIYLRVSTMEQKRNGLSVDSQLLALKEYCASEGYDITAVYNDAGISASKRYTRRPALLQMIKDCQNNKIDVVLFTKLDRFFRSVPDYYECVRQMNGVPWRAIWEDYETETSSGVFKVNIMLSVAQAESDRTSERIKAVNNYIRETGGYVGSAPIGYQLQGTSLIVDEETKPIVEVFFNTFEETSSVSKAMFIAKEKGIPISRDRARNMLTSPTYKGDAMGSKCYAYITEEQFERNSRIMESRRHRQPKNSRVYIFSGLMRCARCGKSMYGTYNNVPHKGKVYQSIAYKCSGAHDTIVCDQRAYIFEQKLERYVLARIGDVINGYQYSASVSSVDDEYENKKAKLENKLDRVTMLFEEGDISLESYRNKRDSIRAEIDQLQKPEHIEPPRLPDNWLDIYNALDKEHRKEFFASVIDKIYVDKNGRDYNVAVVFL